MSWQLFTVLFLCSAFSSGLSEANHGKKLPSAVVVGTVYCDTCFQDTSKANHFISGAKVGVECGNFHEEVKTDERGEFRVSLPSSVSKHMKKIKGCSVKLISSSEPYCAVASTATSSSIHLKSRKEGTHIFSAGFFTFKPLKQPDLCSRKFKSMKPVNPVNDPTLFPPPIQDPMNPTQLPPLPNLPGLPPMDPNSPPLPNLPGLPPLPQLPPLPPLPGVPFIPPATTRAKPEESLKKSEVPGKTSLSNDQKEVIHPQFFSPLPTLPPLLPSSPQIFGIPLPPNPFQPPSILPPNPFQPPPAILPPIVPSPPSSILPPLFPTPVSPPAIPGLPPIPGLPGLPPIPGLTPSPPPPAPTIPIQLPPFPFQPTPGFPGNPPAASSP